MDGSSRKHITDFRIREISAAIRIAKRLEKTSTEERDLDGG